MILVRVLWYIGTCSICSICSTCTCSCEVSDAVIESAYRADGLLGWGFNHSTEDLTFGSSPSDGCRVEKLLTENGLS